MKPAKNNSPSSSLHSSLHSAPPGYKQTEVGVIPEDWEVRSVGEFATIKTGPFGTILKASEYATSGGVPLISVGEIRDGYLKVTDETPRVPKTVTRRLPQYLLRKDDVVFGRKGGVDRSALISANQGGWFLGSDGLSIRSNSTVHSPYIALQLQNSRVKAWLLQHAIGTTMPSLNQAILERVVISVPPTKAEQEAIAEALSDTDGWIASLEQLIKKKRWVKQGAMQDLLTGKRRLPGFTGEWVERRLGDCLLAHPSYGINAPAVPYSDSFPTYLRITDIRDDGRFWPEPRVSVAASRADQFYLAEGDVVFARTGASVGKSYLYDRRDGDLVFAGFLIRVQANAQVLMPSFLAAYAMTKPYWDWVRITSMRSGQPGINGSEYANLTLRLPPLPEQTAIATLLSEMDTEIEALETNLAKARQIKQGMMQELLTGRRRLVWG